jgi:exopolyphosphatase/guanosine-5'-triphosphate,3'-diphosphate pyrophosphatase
VANHSQGPAPDASPEKAKIAAREPQGVRLGPAFRDEDAPGRILGAPPIAIIDIGSNSVRLVVYENLSRSPTPIFNEKEMAGLGRGVASTGELQPDAIAAALSALARFRILCGAMGVTDIRVIATAAARLARNGAEFIAAAEKACGRPIELISGEREAYLSALGVVSGFVAPDGVVGDMGGGSLELIEVGNFGAGQGVSLPLGGLALQDRSGGSIKQAEKIVKDALDTLPQVEAMQGRHFYAVGGTWRALAKLHQRQCNYPLSVMQGYSMPPRDAADFAKLVERVDADILDSIEAVASARRPLLAYGALLLEQIIKRGKPKSVVISAQGVREGLLHEQLSSEERAVDPLMRAAEDYNRLRSRDPRHAAELIAWMDAFFASTGLEETPAEQRLRHVACLLADIGWRAHPDYRGEQSLNVIAHAAFIGIDHPGRAFLALAVFYRYAGLKDDPVLMRLRELLGARMLDRARVLGAAFRVGYLISAAMPGLLPKMPMLSINGKILLTTPPELASLASDRVAGRLKQLARLLGRDSRILVTG